MNKKMVLACVCVGIAILAFTPVEILAGTSDQYGGRDIVEKADGILDYLFGPVLKLVAVFAGAISIYKTFSTGSPAPLTFFVGAGLIMGFIPLFINTVFSLNLP